MDVVIILQRCMVILCAVCLSEIAHELAHAAVSLVLRCPIEELQIGFLCYTSRGSVRKLHLRRKVENHCRFRSASRSKVLWISLAGPAMNGLLAVDFALWAWSGSTLQLPRLIACLYNGVKMIYNLLPSSCGDGALLLRMIKEK